MPGQAPGTKNRTNTKGLALKKFNNLVEELGIEASKSPGTGQIMLPEGTGAKSKFSPGRCWGRLHEGTGMLTGRLRAEQGQECLGVSFG